MEFFFDTLKDIYSRRRADTEGITGDGRGRRTPTNCERPQNTTTGPRGGSNSSKRCSTCSARPRTARRSKCRRRYPRYEGKEIIEREVSCRHTRPRRRRVAAAQAVEHYEIWFRASEASKLEKLDAPQAVKLMRSDPCKKEEDFRRNAEPDRRNRGQLRGRGVRPKVGRRRCAGRRRPCLQGKPQASTIPGATIRNRSTA